MSKSLLLALLLGSSAQALTLEQLQAQLPRSPTWLQADLAYQSSLLSLEGARAAQGPGASLNGSYGLSSSDTQSSSTASVGASLSLNLLPWTPASDRVRSSERALYRAGLDRQDSRNAALLNLLSRWVAVRNAELSFDHAQATQGLAQRQLEAAQGQRSLGNLSVEGLLNRQNGVSSAQSAAQSAQNALELARLNLAQALGLPPSSEPSGLVAPGVVAVPPLEQALTRAGASRSETLKAQSQLEAAQDSLESAQRDRWFPSSSLSLSYGQSGQGGASVSAGLNLKSGAGTLSGSLPLGGSSNPSALSVSLSAGLSLLDPAADAAIASAALGVSQARSALSSAGAQVELDVRQKYADLDSAQAQVGIARSSLTLAQNTLESAQARQLAGLTTALDVESAQVNLTQAQNTLETARANAWLASLRVLNALGGGLVVSAAR